MIEYDAHEPGTWRDAALHFRAENERLTAQLAAVTAERDALREAGDAYRAALAEYERGWDHESDQQWRDRMNAAHERLQETHDALIAALAARGGEVGE